MICNIFLMKALGQRHTANPLHKSRVDCGRQLEGAEPAGLPGDLANFAVNRLH